jgi:serine/threonine-protein kinase
MEYVPGRDLTEFIARGPFAPDLYRDLALQICDAVSATHAAGFVHRDLKPANIRVRNDLCIKVLDFGLARSTRKNKNISSTSLTIPGQIMGSPLYLSPEQSRGEPLDERSDVFALGIILFEMATGGKPFTGKSLAEYCSALEVDQPPRVRDFRRDLPRGLDRVIYGCLRKRRALRFSSGKQVRDALRGCFEESTTRVRSKHILIAGGTGLLLGCMAMLRRQRS